MTISPDTCSLSYRDPGWIESFTYTKDMQIRYRRTGYCGTALRWISLSQRYVIDRNHLIETSELANLNEAVGQSVHFYGRRKKKKALFSFPFSSPCIPRSRVCTRGVGVGRSTFAASFSKSFSLLTWLTYLADATADRNPYQDLSKWISWPLILTFSDFHVHFKYCYSRRKPFFSGVLISTSNVHLKCIW